jgi:O-antigen ligase
MNSARLAAAGLILALAAILLHATGFGYDEVRRPVVILGAALALAGGAARGGSAVLRVSDLALLTLAVSALFAANRTDAVAALFPAIAAWIFLRAIVLGWIPRPFLERHGLRLISCVAIAFSGYGLLQYLGGDFPGLSRGTRLAVSTIGNTNYAGVLSAALALVGLSAAMYERGLPRRLTGVVAALLGGLHVAVSGSLGGLAGLGAGVAAFALLLVRRHGLKPAVLFPLVILALAFVPVAGRVTGRIANIAKGEDRTASVRLGLWKGTLRLTAAHPILGCGTGNFRYEFPPYRAPEERRISHEGQETSYVEADDPHNSYLALLSESGPLALTAILIVLGLSLARGIRRAREPDVETAALAIAGTAGLVTLAVSGLFNSLSSHLPFAVLAAFLAGVSAPEAAVSSIAPSPWMKVARIGSAVLLAIAPLPWFVADVHYRNAMRTRNAGERLDHARRAADALPGHWQARFQIAMCWRALGKSEWTVRAELREVLKVHPHNVAALLELSRGAPPGEEEELLRRAERLAPEFLLVHTRLVGVDLRRRDFASVRRRLERILATMPEEAEALYTMGRTWLMERRPEDAIPWLRRALAKDPKLRDRLAEDHPEVKDDPRFRELLGT